MTEKPKLHIRPADRAYHEQIGARMNTIHLSRYRTQHIYHYGDVSYLKLIDEGRLPLPTSERAQRDLDLYREVIHEPPMIQHNGGAP